MILWGIQFPNRICQVVLGYYLLVNRLSLYFAFLFLKLCWSAIRFYLMHVISCIRWPYCNGSLLLQDCMDRGLSFGCKVLSESRQGIFGAGFTPGSIHQSWNMHFHIQDCLFDRNLQYRSYISHKPFRIQHVIQGCCKIQQSWQARSKPIWIHWNRLIVCSLVSHLFSWASLILHLDYLADWLQHSCPFVSLSFFVSTREYRHELLLTVRFAISAELAKDLESLVVLFEGWSIRPNHHFLYSICCHFLL